MASRKTAVVVGGSSGIGLAVARALAARGEAVWLTSRDPAKAEAAARKVGHGATTIVVDLAKPHEIAERFAAVGPVDHLVITAVDRDRNSVKAYDIAAALKLVTTKLVGYAEVAHIFVERFTPDAAIVLYGGMARDRPYPGSTTVSSITGGGVGAGSRQRHPSWVCQRQSILGGQHGGERTNAGSHTRPSKPHHRALRRRHSVPARQPGHEWREPCGRRRHFIDLNGCVQAR
jgi:NAD(P)-dependent dehydrogenase (short-subunit alcohol dehydrogenase family)